MWRWRQPITVCAYDHLKNLGVRLWQRRHETGDSDDPASGIEFSWAEHGMENHPYATCSGKL